MNNLPLVLDNVIPLKYQEEIEYTLTQRPFDWHLNKTVSYGDINESKKFILSDDKIVESRAFIHRFYFNNAEDKIKSQYCDYIRPLLFFVEQETGMNIASFDRIRGVFVPKDITLKNNYNVPHTDNVENHKTLIYYVNDNDGGTILFKEKFKDVVDYSKKTIDRFVQSKKGRILIFDGLTYHTGVVPSDNDKILININFI